MGYDKFSIDIREVVKLLGLKVSPQSDFNGTSFNVRCPFCNDTKYQYREECVFVCEVLRR